MSLKKGIHFNTFEAGLYTVEQMIPRPQMIPKIPQTRTWCACSQAIVVIGWLHFGK